MQKAGKSDVAEILAYIGRDVARCLYLYADVTVYGLDCPHLELWFDRDGEGICRVVMRYHNSFQIYADRDFQNVAPILELVEAYKPDGISVRREMIENLAAFLQKEYGVVYGSVFQGNLPDPAKNARRLEDCTAMIEQAAEKDAEDIARLICMDAELGSVYTEASLAEELRERMRSGMGRSYVIRDGGKIVAHNATYAETDRFVVVSGLVVHPDYRDTEYINWLDQKSILEFTRGKKDHYFFINNRRFIRYHIRIGNHIVAEYGKLSRKDKTR